MILKVRFWRRFCHGEKATLDSLFWKSSVRNTAWMVRKNERINQNGFWMWLLREMMSFWESIAEENERASNITELKKSSKINMQKGFWRLIFKRCSVWRAVRIVSVLGLKRKVCTAFCVWIWIVIAREERPKQSRKPQKSWKKPTKRLKMKTLDWFASLAKRELKHWSLHFLSIKKAYLLQDQQMNSL